ncbi:MAG: hypothetical protein A2481_02965 [Candidatus Yonathbacteria bacterium RIFOXYC2_FULL_47_9]|nr:MAG: hypothetical protein A2481_02965 [Candidatus Yonathbacteria bacterium RIFOXYC2_FULL_47_9]HAT68653.1 hypothetical protein [Candidatus Yonathbacteria bacterium]
MEQQALIATAASNGVNEQIFRIFNDLAGQNTFLDLFLVFLSNWFGYLLLGGLIIFLVFHKDKKQGARDLFVVLAAAIAAYVFSKVIKMLVPNPRPFEVLTEAHVLYTHGGGDSFPSGHATFYMSLAASLFFYHRKLALVYFLGALIIGLARIAVGVHWPFDILSGWILGAIIGASVYYFYRIRFSVRQLPKAEKSLY